ncbi:uncharacterized protein HD556DRAFT_1447477 [Suillus plorans]|uniref:DUF6533 domain-containing protein n=1 Tax=Suillus plorans TaxID=116603 RepID=A0A9P7AHA5_9AGAM|nr:uncharacterized protein HD556DRAFT_1447477 [Suillus plorans]KAG1788825.1 hypothetical protein HD556DRAFT_1447477 [Suillus plorans]
MTSPPEIALRLQTVKYLKRLAVLVFDYCIKLEAEIDLTWGRRWDFIRILFAVARYTPFVDVPVDLIYSLGPTSSQVDVHVMGKKQSVTCFPTTTCAGKYMPTIGDIHLSHDILQGCIAGSAVVGANALSWFQYQDPPLATSGCYQSQRIAIYAVDYALLVLFETVILCLNVFQAWYRRGRQGSRLITRLYWDGIVYVLCILANIIVIGFLPSEYAESLNTLQLVFHSVLSSRLLFNLRAIMQQQHEQAISESVMEMVSGDQFGSDVSSR